MRNMELEEGKGLFKVGDRVRNVARGEYGTIRHITTNKNTDETIGVEYDNYDPFKHELLSACLSGECKKGHGWWDKPSHLKLIKEFPMINTQARDSVAQALENMAAIYALLLNDAIADIKKADKPEVVMAAKKYLLIKLVENLPLTISTCYFCQVHGFGNCNNCEYAKHHGKCPEGNTDYAKADAARYALREALESYYKGEAYTDPEHAEYLRLKAKFEGKE